MFNLLISIPLVYTSPQYCMEVKHDLNAAVEQELIEQESADAIFLRCLDTYTKGA